MYFYGYDVQKDGTVIGKKGKTITPHDNGRGYLCFNFSLPEGKKFLSIQCCPWNKGKKKLEVYIRKLLFPVKFNDQPKGVHPSGWKRGAP